MRAFSIRTPVRWVVIPLAALAILMLLAWYFVQPLAFPPLGRGDVEQVLVVTYQILPPRTEEITSAAQPQMDVQRQVFSAGSPEAEALQQVLDFRSYHRSWGTLTDTQAIEGRRDAWFVSIAGLDGEGRMLFDMSLTGGQNIFINGRAYQVGWLGGGSGGALTENLAQVLGLV